MKKPAISIVFPVYNEANSIESVLREWKKELKRLKIKHQIIICEDGSTDKTKVILNNLKKQLKLTLNQKRRRRGYGGAVIDGIKTARYEYILCVDSDGQCDPKDLKKFMVKIGKDVLIGWRTKRIDSPTRLLFSYLFGIFFKLLFPHDIHDPSAPFVVFSKKQFIPLIPQLRFLKEGFWWGFIGACVKNNINFIEIPINHRKRYVGDTQVYKPSKMFSIATRNILGLFKLKFT